MITGIGIPNSQSSMPLPIITSDSGSWQIRHCLIWHGVLVTNKTTLRFRPPYPSDKLEGMTEAETC